MKKALSILFISVTLWLSGFAQKMGSEQYNYPIELRKCNVIHPNVILTGELNEYNITGYLYNSLPNLSTNESTLKLIQIKESLSGYHYLYAQYVNNIEVFEGNIKVNIDKKGNISSIFDNTYSTQLISESSSSPCKDCVYFFNGEKLILSKKYTNDHFLYITDDNGDILYKKDQYLYYKDTTALGTVFLPDPLTTAQVNYGAPYIDSNDDDIAQLDAQIDTVVLQLQFDEATDTFYLINNVVKITDHSFPNTGVAKSITNTFYFTRSENGFEDVNAFYHVTDYNNQLRSLGYNNLLNYQINIDTHGLNGQDNSAFMSSFSPPRISFGEGGVDDAEDADVIRHEYTHALMFDATGQDPFGTERSALDEANADIMAASYSRAIDEFRWDEVYTWDGHNEFWDGRMASGNKHYPEDMQNNKYFDTDIWSAAIMEIWEKLGRDATEQLLIESVYSYNSNITMRDAARLFLEADTSLNNGNNTWDICTTMLARGLLSECLVGIDENVSQDNHIVLWNTENFAQGTGDAYLYSMDSITVNINIYDLRGRLIKSHYYPNTERVVISTDDFPQGTYILVASYNNKEKSFKLFKY